jgi:hypothetical protein
LFVIITSFVIKLKSRIAVKRSLIWILNDREIKQQNPPLPMMGEGWGEGDNEAAALRL